MRFVTLLSEDWQKYYDELGNISKDRNSFCNPIHSNDVITPKICYTDESRKQIIQNLLKITTKYSVISKRGFAPSLLSSIENI